MEIDFPGFGLKGEPRNADDVAQIQKLENFKNFFTQRVLADVNLDLPLGVMNMGKDTLRHVTDGHQGACNRNLFVFFMLPRLEAVVFLDKLCEMMALVKTRRRGRIDAL